ncbi:MAG: hypothetical protein GF334_06870 [Candidatus Altiarchaeales archaeon]|nr:hypothetical protein [Candidatus Altiarchaeales archaeon]
MEKILPVKGELSIDMRARQWCELPYPNHPKGCPNYNKRKTCPPIVSTVKERFDLQKPLWVGVVDFDLAAHMERMREKHPDWSARQLACVLYWQAGVNRRLKDLTLSFHKKNKGTIYTLCPEAMGVHVLKTMRRLGFNIRRNPTQIVYKVSLIGYPK